MSRQQPNRLIRERSPYLLQHAYNPVDWYPWGEEAFSRARAEDKPVLLSVGYSACHWCHVMERESFDNEETAAIMNDRFICIKVDREERPDIDQIYQHAVQMLTGQGGWPLTVFLTPDGKPFFGGTYFPPDERYGRPSFRRVIVALSEAWRERRADVETNVGRIMAGLHHLNDLDGYGMLAPEIPREAAALLLSRMDDVNGGFRGAPKFPNGTCLSFLLAHSVRARSERARASVLHTLRKMAEGGIYDHLGGGFHRYSVDAHWLVPHFEKMLYDNALLARLYFDAARLTGDAFFRRVGDETVAYVLREMRSPEGGFYATQDADSEGEEGKFFLWTPAEIEEVAGREDARALCARFGVTPQGNFEHGRTVLHVDRDEEAVARDLGWTVEQVRAALARGKRALFEARERRVKPFRDEKILTSWNGLMIAALARSGDPAHVAAAIAAADFVLAALRPGGRLLRRYKDGEALHDGLLDDHAFLAEGLLQLYQATGDPRWLDESLSLAEALLDRFWDPDKKAFYLTGADVDLVQRPRSAFDQAIPSGAGVACRLLLALSALTGRSRYEGAALEALRNHAESMRENPFGFSSMLEALEGHLGGARQVIVVGSAADDGEALLETARRRYDPDLLLCRAGPEAIAELTRGKDPVGGRATAYVCAGRTCSPPATSPDELEARLEAAA